jgi:two-component system sensor histidine kinase HydH
VLLSAVVLSGALFTTARANYQAVEDASLDLTRGQGEALFESLFGHLRSLEGTPTSAELQTWLDEQSDTGVRYAALVLGPDMCVEAGERVGRPAKDERTSPHPSNERIGERVRVVRKILRRRPLRWIDRVFLGGPPVVVVEFEPRTARDLLERARRGLLINAAGAVALLGAAAVVFRWLRRQESAERAHARQQHLASLGEMSAVLAHEIRNPLASLKGHAQLLEETLPAGKDREKAARVVHEAVRLERLTADLLDFVRTGEIVPTPSPPAAVLERAVGSVDGGDVTIELNTESAPTHWPLDTNRIEQLLINLLKNAIEASLPGGKVEASATLSADSVLEYRVRDHGAGVPSGQEELIFEPFHTGRTRGTGLGLAVARRVAEAHGGTIRAANHPGGGAVFTVRIPPGGK